MPETENLLLGGSYIPWRNTDTKMTTYGIGGAYEKTNDDTDRNTKTDRDLLEQNLKPCDYLLAQKMFQTYWNMFSSGITERHRNSIRWKAREFWEEVENFDDKFEKRANALDAASRRELDKRLCILHNQMSTVGGTTRSCFSARIKADAIVDAEVRLNAEKLAAFQQMQQVQLQGYASANDALYRAFIEADAADYAKLTSILQIMKGSWTKNDMAENVDDRINRDIDTFRVRADWERRSGSTSETSGEYVDDFDEVLGYQNNIFTDIGNAIGNIFTPPDLPPTP